MSCPHYYIDVILSSMAFPNTSLTIVYSTVYSVADQRKHQSSASLAFLRGIHRWPVNSPHKGPVTRKMFPFDDVIMLSCSVSVKMPLPVTCMSEPRPNSLRNFRQFPLTTLQLLLDDVIDAWNDKTPLSQLCKYTISISQLQTRFSSMVYF